MRYSPTAAYCDALLRRQAMTPTTFAHRYRPCPASDEMVILQNWADRIKALRDEIVAYEMQTRSCDDAGDNCIADLESACDALATGIRRLDDERNLGAAI